MVGLWIVSEYCEGEMLEQAVDELDAVHPLREGKGGGSRRRLCSRGAGAARVRDFFLLLCIVSATVSP